MKKSFFHTLLIAAFIAVGTFSATASAAEQREYSSAQLGEAKAYYIENMVIGFDVGRRLAGGKPLTGRQAADVGTACEKWLNDELIPFLNANGILGDWVSMQFDADIRDINRRIAKVKKFDEFMQILKETMELTRKHYPVFSAKTDTPEGAELMGKLQRRLMQAIMK